MSWIKPNNTMDNKRKSLDNIKREGGVSVLNNRQSQATTGGNADRQKPSRPTSFMDRFKWNFNPSSGDVPQ